MAGLLSVRLQLGDNEGSECSSLSRLFCFVILFFEVLRTASILLQHLSEMVNYSSVTLPYRVMEQLSFFFSATISVAPISL